MDTMSPKVRKMRKNSLNQLRAGCSSGTYPMPACCCLDPNGESALFARLEFMTSTIIYNYEHTIRTYNKNIL